MARPNKRGLEYFPLDVDFFDDKKIKLLSVRFGLKGEAIAVRLLCEIYKNGYYLEWDEDAAMLFASGVGESNSLVDDIVKELVKRGFFDKDIFNSFNVLTSKGIQKRFFMATARRKNIDENLRYLLIDDVNANNNCGSSGVNVDNNPTSSEVNVSNNSQSKVKKSKAKKSKAKQSIYAAVPPELSDAFNEWAHMRREIKKPITTERTVTMALNKLDKLAATIEEKIAIINQSTDRCWTSFYELKDESGRSAAAKSQKDYYDMVDEWTVDSVEFEKRKKEAAKNGQE